MTRFANYTLRLALLVLLVSAHSVWAASVTRGPYLQLASDSGITVRWRTDSAGGSVVRYGASPGSLDQSVSVAGSVTEHEVRLDGLQPSTQYYYSVGDSGGAIAGGDSSYRFSTSPQPGTATPTRIWVIGDSGTANANAAAVYNAYMNEPASQATDLWLMLGDNAYNDGTDSEYQAAVFDMYPELLRRAPLWSTLGNHDGHSADSASESGPYYDIFTLPRAGEAGGLASGTEAYYSFDYGDIHFICLDSYESDRSSGGAMLNWLENDLAATSQRWIIAFWHHPPYTKGSHNSDSESALIDMRENALPILESYGVDLVLSGHSHSYERSYLLDGHYGSSGTFTASHKVDGGSGREDGSGAYQKAESALNAGAVYTVAGSSGKTSGGTLNHPAMYTSLNQLGSVVLELNGNRLDARFINGSGGVSDYYTLIKGEDTTAPALVAAEATGGSGVSVAFSEPLEQSSAENTGNYAIDRGVAVQTAALAGDSKTVTLGTSTMTLGESYTLTVSNVQDTGGNPIAAGSQTGFSYLERRTDGFQNGVAPSAGYGGTADATIAEGNPGSNFGSGTSLLLDGDDGGGVDLSSLLRFDLSSIPANATIESARLQFQVYDPSSNSYQIQRLLRDWSESQVTWNQAASGANWGSAGADAASDRDPTVLGSFNASNTGTVTIDLNASGVAAVQGWVDGSQANYGVIIANTSASNGVDFYSSEAGTAGYRPRLEVTYTVSGSGPAPVTLELQQGLNGYSGAADTYVAEGSAGSNYGGDSGILADGHDGSRDELIALLKWDLSSIPSGATITDASVTLQVYNSSSGGYGLWLLEQGWSEASATWGSVQPTDNRGSQVGSFLPNASGSYSIPLNAAGIAQLQGWVNGAQNNGFMLQSAGTNNGVDVRSREYGSQSQRPKLTVSYE